MASPLYAQIADLQAQVAELRATQNRTENQGNAIAQLEKRLATMSTTEANRLEGVPKLTQFAAGRESRKVFFARATGPIAVASTTNVDLILTDYRDVDVTSVPRIFIQANLRGLSAPAAAETFNAEVFWETLAGVRTAFADQLIWRDGLTPTGVFPFVSQSWMPNTFAFQHPRHVPLRYGVRASIAGRVAWSVNVIFPSIQVEFLPEFVTR
jgi:hypothetical protein